MKTYETPSGVDGYVKMCERCDFSGHKEVLLQHVGEGSSMLELGMGPGNDYEWMRGVWRVVGSDYSEEFLKRAGERFPGDKFLTVDAAAVEVGQTFDAIFSNKVHQHFDLPTTTAAFTSQARALNPLGTAAHTFWVGCGTTEVYDDMTFYYHTKEELVTALEAAGFAVLHTEDYNECEEDPVPEGVFNSVFVIARKKD